jgi:hypothetical protein
VQQYRTDPCALAGLPLAIYKICIDTRYRRHTNHARTVDCRVLYAPYYAKTLRQEQETHLNAKCAPKPRHLRPPTSRAVMSLWPTKGKCAALSGPPLRNVQVVVTPQMLYEVVSSCESFVADARAVRHTTGVFWDPYAVHRGLVALQVGQACELRVRCTARDVAGPCSAVVGIRRGERARRGFSLAVVPAQYQFIWKIYRC